MTAAARPSLIPLAGLVSLLVLLLGAAALFALSFTNRKSAAALERLDRLHAAQVTAVETQVSFKTQVQEWKDLLLRGHRPEDFATYRQHFQQRSADVEAGLAALATQLDALGLDGAAARRLLAAHQTLGAAYGKALAGFVATEPLTTFAVDASIRGIDRKLTDEIDALARTVEQTAATELGAFRAAADQRYAMLRRVTLAIGAAAVLAAFWLVFQATRRPGTD